MRINNYSYPIYFQKLNMQQNGREKVISPFFNSVSDYEKTTYHIKTDLIDDNERIYKIKFSKENSYKADAFEKLELYPNAQFIYVHEMRTERPKRDLGIGSRMHLLNIIEMLENNKDEIRLSSSPSAIVFHTKLGFKPDDTLGVYLKTNIEDIIAEKDSRYKDLVHRAYQVYKNKPKKTKKERTKLANEILYEYTLLAMKTKNKLQQKWMITLPVNMKLTKDMVIENKDFYNKLFKKYDIDYEIE